MAGARREPPKPIERLRERLAGVEDGGWFFAQIAERVSARRAELGLSQRELAELTGTTQSAIARLEAGGFSGVVVRKGTGTTARLIHVSAA